LTGRDSWPRFLGTHDAGIPGPTLIAVGGIHGNEPSGPRAIRDLMAELESERPPLRGRFYGICGNLSALARKERFVVRDLNRGWTDEKMEWLGREDHGLGAEDREQLDLARAIGRCLRESSPPHLFLDLHSTSGGGPPFAFLCDALPNRRVALGLRLPIVLGIEEVLRGTLMSLLSSHGHVALGAEGGQHDAEETSRNLMAILVEALELWGMLPREALPRDAERRRLLLESVAGIPPVVEVIHRHPIDRDDGFRMEPGHNSLDRVTAGEVVARDSRGVIESPVDGRILLPLYQGLGEEGFLIVRDVKPIWLRIAAWVRSLGLECILPWLPGVSRATDAEDVLIVDTRIARWLDAQIFHLLGYRRQRREGARVRYRRQAPSRRAASGLMPK